MGERLLKFVQRHRWSLSFGVLSCAFFLQLAWEVQERELGPFDQAVAGWLQAQRGEWDGLMLALTHAGGGWGITSVCVGLVLALALSKQRWAATFAATCGIGALFLTTGLKLIFQRARPEAISHYLIEAPSSFSFPSGHALASTSVVAPMLVLAHALPRLRAFRLIIVALVIAFVLGVASSRVYLGVHYPSDVLGGVLAGASWVAAATGWFYPRLLPGEAKAS